VSGTEVRETHVSTLFLLGERVYKLKKAVRFDFVDLSTRAARERVCHREVELNRRLAPDVYLGVADVVGPDGAPWDHLVVMRRMPEDRRLAALARSGGVTPDDLLPLAHVLAGFHGRAETSPEIARAGDVEAVRRRWTDGFTEIRVFVGDLLDEAAEAEVEARATAYLDGRSPLFEARSAHGRIRDGHGDLLAEDVFLLDDGPRVLDCLEFDDALRHGDVLADVAFLAMDLERLGRPDLAAVVLREHRHLSADTYPASLAHHYVALRAHIRAKVACLRAKQGDEAAAAEARRLLGLTQDHLARGTVLLVLVGGPPGTGKSTLAAGLGTATGWAVLRSDEIRKDLAGMAHHDRAGAAPVGAGLYTDARSEQTYDELLARAGALLGHGESVLLDASWSSAGSRDAAAALARRTATTMVELRCELPLDVALARVSERARRDDDPSDATGDVVRELSARFAPWPGADAVDTAGAPADVVAHARATIERLTGVPTDG
jgi:aminoglycoside phosphotransferase family enzyme/predicted kinase